MGIPCNCCCLIVSFQSGIFGQMHQRLSMIGQQTTAQFRRTTHYWTYYYYGPDKEMGHELLKWNPGVGISRWAGWSVRAAARRIGRHYAISSQIMPDCARLRETMPHYPGLCQIMRDYATLWPTMPDFWLFCPILAFPASPSIGLTRYWIVASNLSLRVSISKCPNFGMTRSSFNCLIEFPIGMCWVGLFNFRFTWQFRIISFDLNCRRILN